MDLSGLMPYCTLAFLSFRWYPRLLCYCCRIAKMGDYWEEAATCLQKSNNFYIEPVFHDQPKIMSGFDSQIISFMESGINVFSVALFRQYSLPIPFMYGSFFSFLSALKFCTIQKEFHSNTLPLESTFPDSTFSFLAQHDHCL